MDEKFFNLHQELVQKVIDYCKENNITNADIFDLHIDRLQDSIECGKWHPGTDSAMGLYGEDKEVIISSI